MDLPLFLIAKLMRWFEQRRREMPWRGSDNPYHIWVSEMMLQQTQVAAVEKYYPKWIARFPDVFSLAQAPLEEVLKVWEGLGYYTRARNFHKGAKYIAERAASRRQPFPNTYEDWLKVPGVGPYTAAAVSSIAFRYPAAVLDANVLRVMARLFCFERDTASPVLRRDLFACMNSAFYDYHPGWVNQAWMELGSLQCKPKPDCSACPLKEFCCAFSRNAVAEFPRKKAKKKIPVRTGAAFIICRRDRFLLLCRPAEGFLGGLWEFPGYTLREKDTDGAAFRNFVQENHLQPEAQEMTRIRHTYSHFHQDMYIYRALLNESWNNPAWTAVCWADRKIADALPLTGLARKILCFLQTPDYLRQRL
ncbi:MAG: A/G-specific adenine glycosylase [Candidatus Neomarinimicrobiota bacterium]|jgi:A/G-specific adenine glycosylase|nr:A/G-specific adenine glycosylase [Candidatus Neomarinimicrobiota bacterium]MDX9779829.1 A/G-specific adenine glycosylase [bacterium]